MLRSVGHRFEGVRRLEVEEAAELVVPGYAPLAYAQHVDRGEVDHRAVGPVELLQEARGVVQRDRARMRCTERVEGVGHRKLGESLADVQDAELRQRVLLQKSVVS